MIRKHVRKVLPSHERIRNHPYIGRFGPWLHQPNLWHLNRPAVAGGVAAGLFAGLVPGSNPVQFAVAALLAILFRVNLPVAVAVTLYSNPFTVVPLYYAAYKLGQLVLMQPAGGAPSFADMLNGKGMRGDWLPAVLDWLGHMGKPLMAGLPLLALSLAAIGYFAVDWSWRTYVTFAWRHRQRRRRKGAKP